VGPMAFANHQSNSVGLVVIAELTQKMLMVHRILHDDIYNRQGAWPPKRAPGRASNCLRRAAARAVAEAARDAAMMFRPQTRPLLPGLTLTSVQMWL
jgi:hypothetical protein